MDDNQTGVQTPSMAAFGSHEFSKEESHPTLAQVKSALQGVVTQAGLFELKMGEKSGELTKIVGKLENEVKKVSQDLVLKLNNTVQNLAMQSKALTSDEDITAAVTYVQATMTAMTVGEKTYDISSIKLNNVLRDSQEKEVSLSIRMSSTANTADVKRRGLKTRSKTADGSDVVSGHLRDLAAKVNALDTDTQDMLIMSLEIRDLIIQVLRYVSYLRLITDSGVEYAKEARLSVISYQAGKQALGETITNLSNDEQIAIRREYEAINGMKRLTDTTVDLGVYSTFSFRQSKGGALEEISGFYADNMLTSSDMRKYRLINAGPDQIVVSRCSAFTEPMSAPAFDKDLNTINEILDAIKLMDVLVLSAISLTDNESGEFGSETTKLLSSLKLIQDKLRTLEGNNQEDLDLKLGISIKDKGKAEEEGVKAAISVRDDVKDSNAARALLNLSEKLNS